MKKLIITFFLALLLSSAAAFAQPRRHITQYDPDTAIHPFRLIALFATPPLALLNVFIRGGYHVLDTEPIRRAFNVDNHSRLTIDEDY